MKNPTDDSNSYHDQDFDAVTDCLALLDLGFKVFPVTVDLPQDAGVGEGGDYHGLARFLAFFLGAFASVVDVLTAVRTDSSVVRSYSKFRPSAFNP